jgi:histidine ammonia-lyase
MSTLASASVVTLEGRGLTPEAVTAVAGEGAPVGLSAQGRARNAAAAAAVERLVAAGRPVYGVTTGVGTQRDRRVTAAEVGEHQRRLLRSHAAGIGEPLEPHLVRAAMVVRLNQLCAGGAGASDALLDALLGMLDAGLTPVTHDTGSLGTGDLSTLAEIGLALIGEGAVWEDGRAVPAGPALARAGLAPPELGTRDGAALISSNAPTIGRAALALGRARALHEAALAVAALSFEAYGADQAVLDARVHAARPLPGQVAVAARMRALLAPGMAAGTTSRHAVHDPFGFRCQPQVDGAARQALDALASVLAVELNAAAENPLIAAGDGLALSSGNFHAAALALALDAVRAALAQAARLVAERTSALLDSRSSGLPDGLAAGPEPSSGAIILEYTVHGAAGELGALATPAAAQHVSIAGGIESHASFAPTAARLTEAALERYADALAAELVVATRALRLARREARGAGTRPLVAQARRCLPPDLRDRPLTEDLHAARVLVERLHATSPR